MERIKIKAIPGAAASRVTGWLDDSMKVRLAAVPEKDKANKELVRFLAAQLGISKSSIQLVSGASSANKILEIEGLSEAELKARLNKQGSPE